MNVTRGTSADLRSATHRRPGRGERTRCPFHRFGLGRERSGRRRAVGDALVVVPESSQRLVVCVFCWMYQ